MLEVISRVNGDDAKEAEEGAGYDEEETGSGSEEEASLEDEEDQHNDLEDLSWGEVFGDTKESVDDVAANEKEGEDDDASLPDVNFDEEEGEEESAAEKETRMTTSKRKAENFYDRVNVKNKNREKSSKMRQLQKSGQKDRGPRIGANKKGAKQSGKRR